MTQTENQYRVKRDGSTVEVILGWDERVDGTKSPIVRSIVGRAGQVLDKRIAPQGIAPHLEERFKAGDPVLLEMLEVVDKDGNVVSVSDEEREAAEAQATALNRATEIEASRGDFDPMEHTLTEVRDHMINAPEEEQERVADILQEQFVGPIDDASDGESGDDELKGDELKAKLDQLDVPGRSKMDAEQKRSAVERIEGGEDANAVVADILGDDAPDSVKEAVAGGSQYDPKDQSAEDVVEYLQSADEDERNRVIAAEKEGKNRSTIVNFEPKDEGSGS